MIVVNSVEDRHQAQLMAELVKGDAKLLQNSGDTNRTQERSE